MEARCYSKYQRYSRRKVGQVLDQVRGKTLFEAEQILGVIPKGCTGVIYKAIRSAGANLSVKLGKKLDLKSVWIKTVHADQGPMKQLKRYHAGPMGRGMPYKRKMCHLTVIVSDTNESNSFRIGKRHKGGK